MRITGLGKLLVFLIGLGLVVVAADRFLPPPLRIWEATADRAPAKSPENGAPGGASGRSSDASAATSSDAPPAAGIALRLHGSNTVGKDLAPALAERFLARQGASQVRRIAVRDDELTVVGTLSGEPVPVAIEIQAHGSSTAFADLASGSADVGMASRRIKPDERSRLSALGDLTSAASEHVLGLDGVAVIVNRSNPVDALTVDQVRDLFSGAVADWSALGGPPGAVTVHARDDRSGTWDTFKNLVLHDRPLAAGAARTEDSRRLSTEVAADPRAIGFVGLAYVGDAKAVKVSEGRSIPYRPTVFTVRTEDYLLSRRLYLYTASSPANPWVARFVEFALSDEGQAVVDALGFVGQGLAAAPAGEAVSPAAMPAEYALQTGGATRLALNFRFESGSDRLDNKALRDIGRLLGSLAQPAHRDRQVLLFGFADSNGTAEVNLALSRARAAAVARELEAEGIRATVVRGFGEAMPVASNESDEGRARNRRVEIWLK